jgi:hypothetical protein
LVVMVFVNINLTAGDVLKRNILQLAARGCTAAVSLERMIEGKPLIFSRAIFPKGTYTKQRDKLKRLIECLNWLQALRRGAK